MYQEVSTKPAFLGPSCPPAYLEYVWYLYLFYWMLGAVWNVVIPAVGGVIWVLIALVSFFQVSNRASLVYKPVAWGLCTGFLSIGIQILFHGWSGSVAQHEMTEFAYWISLLITVQALSFRPGFLHRFALVAAILGVACLPYIQVREVGGVMRAWAAGTLISTPNVLGMWFGFCTVYFVFHGFQSQKAISRVANWSAAIGCFYVVLIAVSRAPLVAVFVACLVGFRSVLKRSFAPLMAFAILIYLVYLFGVFDEWLDYYLLRGAEESGRGRIWPSALERIPNSPWIGFGLDDVRVLNAWRKLVNPHNPLLHLMLGVGVLPTICFLGYVFRAIAGAVHLVRREQQGEAMILPPLVVFASLEIMNLDFAFMLPWVVVVFGLAARAGYQGEFQNPRTS